MPGEVKALYLNNESIAQAAEYVEVADSCGINAFVVDIMDGGAIAYPSEVIETVPPPPPTRVPTTRWRYIRRASRP